MRRDRVVNVLLTVNAVLLAALLLVVVNGGAGPDRAASAQAGSSSQPIRFPNASTQRIEILKAIRALDRKLEANTKALSGTIDVRVTNLDEIEVTVSDPPAGRGD